MSERVGEAKRRMIQGSLVRSEDARKDADMVWSYLEEVPTNDIKGNIEALALMSIAAELRAARLRNLFEYDMRQR